MDKASRNIHAIMTPVGMQAVSKKIEQWAKIKINQSKCFWVEVHPWFCGRLEGIFSSSDRPN
jgi:hypothetical protein